MKCASCSHDLPPRADNPFHPFCSRRCKLSDLGRWLGEEYVIPGRAAAPDEIPPAAARRRAEEEA